MNSRFRSPEERERVFEVIAAHFDRVIHLSGVDLSCRRCPATVFVAMGDPDSRRTAATRMRNHLKEVHPEAYAAVTREFEAILGDRS